MREKREHQINRKCVSVGVHIRGVLPLAASVAPRLPAAVLGMLLLTSTAVAQIVVVLLADGMKFPADAWNILDFIIVGLGWIGKAGKFVWRPWG